MNVESFVLKGTPPGGVKILEGKPFGKAINTAAQLCFLQLMDCSAQSSFDKFNHIQCEDIELEQLKKKYSTVFEDRTDLPPHRGVFDHKIPLLPNVSLVNISLIDIH